MMKNNNTIITTLFIIIFIIFANTLVYSRGFVKDENDEWMYKLENGTYDTNNFRSSGNKKFWLGEDGHIGKNILIKDREGDVYYIDGEGCPVQDSLVLVNENTKSNFKIDKEYEFYFKGKTGKAEYKIDKSTGDKIMMEKKIRNNPDGSINYVDQDGEKITNALIRLKNEDTNKSDTYYFDSNGNRVTNYLLTYYTGKIYYFGEDGKRVKNVDVLVDESTNANIKTDSKYIYHFSSSSDMSSKIDIAVSRDYQYDIDSRTIKIDLKSKDSIEEPFVINKNDVNTNLNENDRYQFGVYEQDNNIDNGEEKIDWLIIDENEKEYVLLSEYVLECNSYDDYDIYKPYNESGLGNWLNDYFLWSAFTIEEQNKIIKKNGVFISIPKIEDANKIKEKFGIERIKAYPTKYAMKHGAELNEDGYTSYWLDEKADDNKVKWIGASGKIYDEGQDLRLRKGDGIRLIIHIKK